ncbi:uncharacterized protein METZ01_LOCUS222124 [marine metagenome]|jgi:hypothetical protein|uniref:Uncharacterized protein n=1 Tax=marine metagenome TaxID=408172 RepID=A0A382G213_9ZZZZ|tara:strand:+ start:113 stop:328 length:216 start_codon:yes stop_codon:yes gene_type:complete
MGMSSYILDNVDKFWDIAENTIGECESLQEFTDKMLKHGDLLAGSGESQYIEDSLYEAWQEKQSKYRESVL